MATRRAKQLVNATITAALVVYATVPVGSYWEVTEVLISNNGAAGAALFMQIAGITCWREQVAAASSLRREFFTVMNAGDTLKLSLNAGATCTISGIEVTP